MSEVKSEFQNTTQGMLGVCLYDEEGKRRGGIVRPGDTIWLSENEQIATANAPKLDKDNPLANGDLKKVTDATEVKNRRPLTPGDAPSEPVEQEAAPEETPAAPQEVSTPVEPQVPPTPPDRTAAEAAKAEAERRAAQPAPKPETKATPAAQEAAVKKPAPQGQRAATEEVATPQAAG